MLNILELYIGQLDRGVLVTYSVDNVAEYICILYICIAYCPMKAYWKGKIRLTIMHVTSLIEYFSFMT